MSNSHSHTSARRPLAIALGLILGLMVGEVVFGIVAGSLALFVIVYTVLVLAFLLYAWRAVRLGPSEELEVPLHDGRQRAAAAGAPPASAAAPA